MLRVSFRRLLTTGAAILFSTLTACGTSPAPTPPIAAPAPVLTTQVETRKVCPAELDQQRPKKPVAADGAQIKTNDAGAEWLKALTGWADDVAGLFDDAQATCRREAGS